MTYEDAILASDILDIRDAVDRLESILLQLEHRCHWLEARFNRTGPPIDRSGNRFTTHLNDSSNRDP